MGEKPTRKNKISNLNAAPLVVKEKVKGGRETSLRGGGTS